MPRHGIPYIYKHLPIDDRWQPLKATFPTRGRFAIVVARFNSLVTEALLAGCRDAFARHGVPEQRLDVAWVPGSFEIPSLTRTLADWANTRPWCVWGVSFVARRTTTIT